MKEITVKYYHNGLAVVLTFNDEVEAQAKAAILVMHGYRVTIKSSTKPRRAFA